MTENITLGHLLHGAVSTAAQDHFIEGRYRSAVGDGIAAVFGLIRARTGLEMDGDPLATKALSLSNPRLIMGNLTTDSGRNVQKWQKACKTFQGPGEKSVEKFPLQVI